MMDPKYIEAILQVILESNMSDLNLHFLQLRPITLEKDEQGKEIQEGSICVSDSFAARKSMLSSAWVAANLLLFTVFDGYLENKYSLAEGASFRVHYDNLPYVDDMELVQKNCYRILKLIRNAIQHNLSNVNYDNGNYDINYTYRGTDFKLNISKNGMTYLYSIVVYLMKDSVLGIYKGFRTKGHFKGVIQTLYHMMEKEISVLEDDINGGLLSVADGLKLRALVRYPVRNPHIIDDSEDKVVFKYIDVTFDTTSAQYRYSTDYVYNGYLLPQEIGDVTIGNESTNEERRRNSTITFRKSYLSDEWKVI